MPEKEQHPDIGEIKSTLQDEETKLSVRINEMTDYIMKGLASPDSDRILDGKDIHIIRSVQNILYESGENLDAGLAELQRIFSAQEGDMKKMSFYAIHTLADRNFFDGKKVKYAEADQQTKQELNKRQAQKRETAWKLYKENFGSTKLSEQKDKGTKKIQLKMLHRLMESCMDPDFGDQKMAEEIIKEIDVPEERVLFEKDGTVATLSEYRLNKYNAEEANKLTNDNKVIDKQTLEDFTGGNSPEIRVYNTPITQELYRKQRDAASIKMELNADSLARFIGESRYKTIHDSKEAQEVWEKVNPGYLGRRIGHEEELGIRSKGTTGDEQVISAYLSVPEAMQPNGQVTKSKFHPDGVYGAIKLVLKKEARERTGFVKGDAFTTSDNPAGNRMNFDTAVLYASAADAPELKGKVLQYIEAQVYGGVTIDDIEDIELGNLGFDSMSANGSKDKLAGKLKAVKQLVDSLGLDKILRLSQTMKSFGRDFNKAVEEIKKIQKKFKGSGMRTLEDGDSQEEVGADNRLNKEAEEFISQIDSVPQEQISLAA